MNEENNTMEITADLNAVKVGDYVMLTFKPEAKLKDAEGFLKVMNSDRPDDDHYGQLVVHRGKQQRTIDLWKISEAIAVEPPAIKKAVARLAETAPDVALTGVQHASEVTPGETLVRVDPNTLWVEEGFNPREKLSEIDALVRSIKANGWLDERAITARRVVKDDGQGNPIEGLEVVDGHRRHLAAIKAGVPSVTVFVKDHRELSDSDRLVVAMLANDGVRLTIMERANAIKRLLDSGLTRKQAAEKLGKPIRYITDHMRLFDAHPDLIKAAQDRKLPAGFVLDILRDHPSDKDAQARITRVGLAGVGARKMIKQRARTIKQQEKQEKKEEKAKERALLKKTMPRTKAVAMLAELSDVYLAFKRSRSPARDSNETWVALEDAMKKVQRMKKRGLLKIS